MNYKTADSDNIKLFFDAFLILYDILLKNGEVYMKTISPLITIIENIEDPRVDRTRLHNLVDIIMISICAAMCGMLGWEDIQDFGKNKEEWFKKFIPLPNGIPSHDTFRRVFERINPKQLEIALIEWMKVLNECLEGKIVAIDGKTLRSSFDKSKGMALVALIVYFTTALSQSSGECNAISCKRLQPR